MSDDEAIDATNGSSPVGRGGAGVYIEGQVGAFYLITLLANTEPRGLPGSRILSVGFQGKDLGYALDDLYMQGMSASGKTLLEIQSKRTITFSPRDSVFKEVCEQIAKSFTKDIPEERHRLAVATQRTSKAISGPYQDVLKWARTAQNGAQFFQRLDNKGIYGAEMRKFSKTFQTNLIAAGVPKDDETIWKIFKRFLILEFDFESCSPLAHTHVLSISKQILSPEDESRSEALWSNLIEISLESAKTGRVIDRLTLQNILIGRGFRLLSDKKFYIARERMAELSCQSLADIGNTIAGIHLPRLRAVALLEKALDEHRFVEIKGGPGVGKSAVLRNAAERIISEALVLVLDPLTTPEGGWAALSQVLNIRTTLKEFLNDLAVSGGGVLFIDSLEMFTSPAQRRTINDLLREIAVTNGFSVVATSRLHFNSETESWLAPDVISTLGQPQTIIVNELDEEEVKTLRILAPELGLLLKSSHPASSIARNLYRLSRLLKVPSVAKVHSEVTLAQQWWKSADNADPVVLRAAQRLIARIAEATLAGRDLLNVYDDSPARSHLLDSQSLIEPNRDHLRFYHDVLRDWAIGARLQEEDGILSRLNLEVPTSPKISRGIEFAGRFALELNPDCNSWLRLLEKLSPPGAHSSWRREALMAIIRSELSQEQLERCSQILLVNNGSLLIELSIAITTIETVPPADFVSGKSEELIMWASSIPKEIRIASSDSALKLLIWCIRHAAEIPIQAIASILALVETLLLLFQKIPVIAEATGNMLFDWLVKLDDPDSNISIPGAQTRNLSIEHYRMLERLRITSLTFSSYIPVRLKTYLKALLEQKKFSTLVNLRPASSIIAGVTPQEFADLVSASLIVPKTQTGLSKTCLDSDSAERFHESLYTPPSPTHQPFLSLLEKAPVIGLELVQTLVNESVTLQFSGEQQGKNGITLVFDNGPRFFPWTETYFWSHGQAPKSSTASALMALKLWGDNRIQAGEPLNTVIGDVLGHIGSCAAFILVAVDLLLSNWPESQELLIPFITCPELLSTDFGRTSFENSMYTGPGSNLEPEGKVILTNVKSNPLQFNCLEYYLANYFTNDETSKRIRLQLETSVAKLGYYGNLSGFDDPAFMGFHALNILDPRNWILVDSNLLYQAPTVEVEHLEKIKKHFRSVDINRQINIAISDAAHGSTELAREAAELMQKILPNNIDSDALNSTSTKLAAVAMLIVRDGDDFLLKKYESWVREVILQIFAAGDERYSPSEKMHEYSKQALAAMAQVHLWCRLHYEKDRNALLSTATRGDCCTAIALSTNSNIINANDSLLLKSAIRIAFKANNWWYHPWDKAKKNTEPYVQLKMEGDRLAVEAEIAWLDGLSEPLWPIFADDNPSETTLLPARAPEPEVLQDLNESSTTSSLVKHIHTDSRAAALWLALIAREISPPAWSSEIIDNYTRWSATMNGLGQPLDTVHVSASREWNNEFYTILANELIKNDEKRFDENLRMIEELPDSSFCDVAEILIQTTDAWYLKDSTRPSTRPVELRKRIVNRLLCLQRWYHPPILGQISIDVNLSGIIATLFINTLNSSGNTESYILRSEFERAMPLLDVLKPLLNGGPTPFLAKCVMNTLSISHDSRNLDFLLLAAEAWLDRLPNDKIIWVEYRFGSRIIEWLFAFMTEEPSFLKDKNILLHRMNMVIGKLVSLGVSEAYELEKLIGHNSSSS